MDFWTQVATEEERKCTGNPTKTLRRLVCVVNVQSNSTAGKRPGLAVLAGHIRKVHGCLWSPADRPEIFELSLYIGLWDVSYGMRRPRL